MGEVVTFRPVMHFPRMVIWHNGDQKNTTRGHWFYRDADGVLRGPFASRPWAQHDMVNRAVGENVPMRTAFERDGMWWWKKDTPEGPKVDGPYLSEAQVDFVIKKHIQALKDSANAYR